MSDVGVLAVLSVLAATGMLLVISGWTQRVPALAATVRHISRRSQGDAFGEPSGVTRMLGRLTAALRRRPFLLPTDAQLRLAERRIERHVADLAAAATVGLLLPGLIITSLQRAGLIGLGWYAPVAAGVAGAAIAPMLVHARVVEHAAAVRTDMRYQVSAYLDVVTMLLAGNVGYEGALDEASRAGDGRLFAELRRRMREVAAHGASLTEGLQRVADDLAIDELDQIAATARLSAGEGAPVARTLAAKCATLRSALATEQESEARLRTTRLSTPIVGMALIFMALVIYPALTFS